MSAELVILIPVAKRPHRVLPVVDSIGEATPDARVLFLCDPKDDAEIEALEAVSAEFDAGGGNYAAKINRGIEMTREPLIFLGADDLYFRPGWFDHAKAAVKPGIGVVGIRDTIRRPHRPEHVTHFLVTREYATEQGAIDGPGLLHEGYDHSFVDDELLATARHRKAYAYAPKAIVEHFHWMNGKAPDDLIYRRGRARFRQDQLRFGKRARLWT